MRILVSILGIALLTACTDPTPEASVVTAAAQPPVAFASERDDALLAAATAEAPATLATLERLVNIETGTEDEVGMAGRASYRVVGVRGGLLQSSRVVNVNAVDRVGTVTPSWKPPAPPRKALPVARECRFQFRFDQGKDSARLWQCLDQALADIAARIAEDPIWLAPSPKSTSLD